MVSEQPTREMVKRLRNAGFKRTRTSGSHSWWTNPDTNISAPVPDGHRTISAGVVRKIMKAIGESDRILAAIKASKEEK